MARPGILQSLRQSESEHASLIDEHARLIMWQVGSICVLI